MKEVEIKDVKGQRIQIGDIIYRAKFSTLTIHRVLNITKRSIVLSSKIETRNHFRYDGTLIEWTCRVDTYTIESLNDHNDKIYINNRYVQGFIKY